MRTRTGSHPVRLLNAGRAARRAEVPPQHAPRCEPEHASGVSRGVPDLQGCLSAFLACLLVRAFVSVVVASSILIAPSIIHGAPLAAKSR